MDAIRIENCTFTYEGDTLPAVDHVSLTVREGEFVAILGHNGSGKSSLAKLINALETPDEGTVTVAGMRTDETDKLWQIRAEAGMVFQNPDNQIVAAIVEDDVAFGPENIGVKPAEIRRRVDEALAAVGMSAYAKHAPHTLSGGQKQRVAIAGILALQSRIIILDEPTAMLDPLGRREVLDTIRRLNRDDGITIVLITHFMEEAALADRVFVMEDARLVAEGTPREVFADRDMLRRTGLTPPNPVRLRNCLTDEGLALPADAFTDEEVIEEICRSL